MLINVKYVQMQLWLTVLLFIYLLFLLCHCWKRSIFTSI